MHWHHIRFSPSSPSSSSAIRTKAVSILVLITTYHHPIIFGDVNPTFQRTFYHITSATDRVTRNCFRYSHKKAFSTEHKTAAHVLYIVHVHVIGSSHYACLNLPPLTDGMVAVLSGSISSPERILSCFFSRIIASERGGVRDSHVALRVGTRFLDLRFRFPGDLGDPEDGEATRYV